jgi:hypothetical protein
MSGLLFKGVIFRRLRTGDSFEDEREFFLDLDSIDDPETAFAHLRSDKITKIYNHFKRN